MSKLGQKKPSQGKVGAAGPQQDTRAQSRNKEQAAAPPKDDKKRLSLLSESVKTEKSVNEMELLYPGRFQMYIIKPTHIGSVWAGSKMKEELTAIFKEHFKPKSSIEQEKVEHNEINIFAEYQLHNLIFAKNELLFNDYKAALLLQIFWSLLEFDPDSRLVQGENDLDMSKRKNSLLQKQLEQQLQSNDQSMVGGQGQDLGSSARYNSTDNQIKYLGDGINQEEARFGMLLQNKFALFRELMFNALNDTSAALKFNAEEIKRITNYAKETYFKHLRLYDYVLNNKQFSEVKRITFQMNEPIIATNLNNALLLGAEEQLGYEDEEEDLRQQILRKQREFHEAVQRMRAEEEERERRRQQELEEQQAEENKNDSEAEMEDMDDRLRNANIDKESKIIIKNKLNEMDATMQRIMEERQKQLDERMNAGKKK